MLTKEFSIRFVETVDRIIIMFTTQGQGNFTTNNQSVSMSWYRAQSRTIDQSLLSP
jgi:hypothetical protein